MLRQASAPRLPERDTTPIRPARKRLPLNAGMMPTKHSPGVTMPAVLGPTTQQPLARAAAMIAMTSRTGMNSVRTTSVLAPASMASSAAALAASGGMNMTEASKPPASIAARALSNTGTPQCPVPAFLGLTPPTTLVP